MGVGVVDLQPLRLRPRGAALPRRGRARARFAAPVAAEGRVRLASPEEARRILPVVYAAATALRPGSFARSQPWWELRLLLDPEWQRGGASKLRFAIYEERGEARGYLRYRVNNPQADDAHVRGVTRVVELQARDASAEAALWRYAFDLDLEERLVAWNLPLDHPLPWLLADPRRARQQLVDSIWVRVIDVQRALEGRRYAASDRLVLEIRDPFLPDNAGTYSLEGGPDGAKCARTTESADLRLDVSDLGALYLGGHRFQTLACRAHRRRRARAASGRRDVLLGPAPVVSGDLLGPEYASDRAELRE